MLSLSYLGPVEQQRVLLQRGFTMSLEHKQGREKLLSTLEGNQL